MRDRRLKEQALQELAQGRKPADVATRLSIPRSTVTGWARQLAVARHKYAVENQKEYTKTRLLPVLKEALLAATLEVEKLEPLEEQVDRLEQVLATLSAAQTTIQKLLQRNKDLDVRLLALTHPVNGEGSLTGR